MTEKPKSYLAEMSTKVVKYLSKIHRKYRKVKVQSLPFIIEFDVKEKVSDLIIEFQLATNLPELSFWISSKVGAPKRKRWLIMHSKWEGSRFALRIFFPDPFAAYTVWYCVAYGSWNSGGSSWTFRSETLFFCHTTLLAKNLSFRNFFCSS